MNKHTEIFTCSCSTTYCNCKKNFTSSTTTSVSCISTTTEMYINGEKETKINREQKYDKDRSHKDMVGQSLNPRTYL